MNRVCRGLLVCVFAASLAVFASCAGSSQESASSSSSGSDAHDAETTSGREIVCWGDSMTEGIGASEAPIVKDGTFFDASYKSYPEILQELTGIETFNFGVSGATSEEIAYMQGALRDAFDPDGESTVDEDVMERGQEHSGDVLVLEIGSNGGWDGDYGKLIEQYRAMLAHADCEDYIIVGDTDDPGTSIADLEQESFGPGAGTGETVWEAALREAFGEHFVNMRAFLVESGLEVAGLEATEDDKEMMERGCVPDALRSDWTHLNSYGYYAQAVAVFEKGRDLGYWG